MVSSEKVILTGMSHGHLVVLLLAGLLLGGASAFAGDVAVVVHPAVPVTNLSFNEFRKIALGDRQHWNHNLRVTLIMRAPGAPERALLLRNVYEMDEGAFLRFWRHRECHVAFTPKTAASAEAEIELVSGTAGAMGFLPAGAAKGLKVLRIDGKLPGDPGYRLHTP